jgi:methyltransferase (TIGR00027 family)
LFDNFQGVEMRAEQPSITAENNAAVRAFESMRPAADRICYDPFARYFLANDLSRARDTVHMLSEMMSRWNLVVPGVCEAILARTRFIDDLLQAAIEEGLQQLVILGAGYDTRALRFDRLKKDTAVFELDHPATQQVKQQRLKQHRLRLPDRMAFIPCRFDREDFTAKLLGGGYDPDRITFFIWEGVSYYLSPADVDRTLAFIAKCSPAGSAVVFDYFPPSVIDGTCRFEEAVVLRQALKLMGEEIKFGIEPGTIGDFLSARGLVLAKNLTSEDSHRRYRKGIDGPANVSAMFYFAHATVNPEIMEIAEFQTEKGGSDA